MKNISKIADCYGCGVCASVCGKRIIEIVLNDDGFYVPQITKENLCTSCGLCIDVCAYVHDTIALKEYDIKSYAAWSKDNIIRRKCSSGGIGFEVGRYLLGKGYKVCGVRYNVEAERAEHYIATSVQELIPSIGSKYIQSYTLDAFKVLNRKERYLITGTPCQIDSFRRYIQRFKLEDNFVLMDFFCHGVPSMWLWKRYTHEVEKITGKITYASWRNKFTGWHDSWAMAIDGKNQAQGINQNDSYDILMKERKTSYLSRMTQGDTFYYFFLTDACLGKSCYEKCKYKYDSSSADIRIGDLWGNAYQENEDGVSAAIAFTDKGKAILNLCGCELREHPFEIVAEGQMKRCPSKPIMRKYLLHCFKHNYPLRSLKIAYSTCRLPQKLFNKIRRVLE